MADAKFILTVRDSQKWIQSQTKHFSRDTTPMRKFIYGTDKGCPLGNEAHYIATYQFHNAAVRGYFKDRPGKLLGTRRFLCIWADGVCFKPRMAEEKHCVPVVIGADEYGRKELLAMTDGFRESTRSWREVLLDLKRRGLKQDPRLAIGDGALGFWAALREVFATTREQRCWLHKTMNVLNAMPKAVQAKAKAHLHDISLS